MLPKQMKYSVTIAFPVYVTAIVEASGKDEAIEKAQGECYLGSYAGNGSDDKLVGVEDCHLSVEAGETPLEGKGFEPFVEEFEEEEEEAE